MNHLHATTVPWFHLELLELMSGLMCFFNFPRILYAGALHIYIYMYHADRMLIIRQWLLYLMCHRIRRVCDYIIALKVYLCTLYGKWHIRSWGHGAHHFPNFRDGPSQDEPRTSLMTISWSLGESRWEVLWNTKALQETRSKLSKRMEAGLAVSFAASCGICQVSKVAPDLLAGTL